MGRAWKRRQVGGGRWEQAGRVMERGETDGRRQEGDAGVRRGR